MSVGSAIVIGIIAVISFIYSMLTLPIYFLVQQPWKMRQRIKDVKVRILVITEDELLSIGMVFR